MSLHDLHASAWIRVLIHGGGGAARAATTWARANAVPIQEFRADHIRHPGVAYPFRNKLMLTEGQPDLVVATPGGPFGTADLLRRVRAANVKLWQLR